MSFTDNSWGRPGGSGPLSGDEPMTFVSGEPRHLTKLPLFLMIGILVFSLALLLIPFFVQDTFLEHDAVSVVGYLLTPFASIGMLAWTTALDSKLRLDVWYDRKVGILVAVRAIAAVSFLVGMVHMWQVATIIARMAAGGIA